MKVQQPSQLSKNGIMKIMTQKISPNEVLILQILNMSTNYNGIYYGQLSDGDSKIKCELGQKLKQKIQDQQLQNTAIVQFTQQQCQITQSHKISYIVLYDCKVINRSLDRTIGQPIYYDIYKEKNFINQQGSNIIHQGPKTYLIKQITTNTLGKLPLKGKVIKIPKSLNKGMMMFEIEDQNNQIIQGICFQHDTAEKIFNMVKLGQFYIFTNYIIQKNKKTGNQELKFKNPDCIVPYSQYDPFYIKKQQINVQKSQNIDFNIQSENLKLKLQGNFHNSNEKIQQQQQISQQFSTKGDLIHYLNFNPDGNKIFNTIGKVTYLNEKSKFRKINIIDQNRQQIDMLIWQQIKQPIILDKIYKFMNMRIKRKDAYVQLHSTRNTNIEQIQSDQWKLMILENKNLKSIKRAQSYNKKNNQDFNEVYKRQRTKRLPNFADLTTLRDIIIMSESENIENYYPYAECYIKIRTDALRFRDDGDSLNFFNFFCGVCKSSVSVTLGDNDVIFCNRCRKNDIQAKWSLRVRVMDTKTQIPCSLQNQTTQKLLNLSAVEGFKLYMKNKQEFSILLNSFNFEQRVCKFQIKSHGVNKYFNVIEIYRKQTQKELTNAMDRLRKITESLQKQILLQ